PGALAALRLPVDAGVSFGEDDLRAAVVVQVADGDDGGDVVFREAVLLPLVARRAAVSVPVGPGDQLVLPVPVQVRQREALLPQSRGDGPDARAGTHARVLRQRDPVEVAGALVPEDEAQPAVVRDVADQLVVELV